MSVEIIYFKAESNSDFEGNIQRLGGYKGAAVAQDRRTFLVTLSESLGRSDVIITVGQVSLLASVLSRGLGIEAAPVDWKSLNLEDMGEVTLPSGAIPLTIGSEVYGFILENQGQSIIAADSDEGVLNKLAATYLIQYVGAVNKTAGVEPAENKAPEQDAQNEQESDGSAAYNESDFQDLIDSDDNTGKKSIDSLFDQYAMSEDEIDEIMPPKKRHPVRNLIIILIILAVIGAGAFSGNYFYLQPKNCDEVYADAYTAFKSGGGDATVFPIDTQDYNSDMSALYKQNSDIIGFLNLPRLNVHLPVVTDFDKGEKYYQTHLFDGSYNRFGTLYINGAYDSLSNLHINTVIHGNNTGDTRMFSALGNYLDEKFVKANDLIYFTSLFYVEEKYKIISVMTVDKNDKTYDTNMLSLTVEERHTLVNKAIKNSKFKLFEGDEFGVSLYDNFITLIAPYSEDKSKNVVVFARLVQEGEYTGTDSTKDQPTASETESETLSQTESETSSGATASDNQE